MEQGSLDKKIYVVLIGPPGVGKGTQATLLQDKMGALQLASGDIYRKEIEAQTELGKTAKNYVEQGQLVPDSVTINMMRGALGKREVKEKGFILDGFPRTVEQAKSLDEMLKELEMPLTAVISIDVPDEVVVERISGRLTCPHCNRMYHVKARPPKQAGVCDVCGTQLVVRKDDNPETIRERLKTFHQNTKPVIDYYRSTNRLLSVDGSLSPEQVYQQIVDKLTAQ
jgi:adenylate kinase